MYSSKYNANEVSSEAKKDYLLIPHSKMPEDWAAVIRKKGVYKCLIHTSRCPFVFMPNKTKDPTLPIIKALLSQAPGALRLIGTCLPVTSGETQQWATKMLNFYTAGTLALVIRDFEKAAEGARYYWYDNVMGKPERVGVCDALKKHFLPGLQGPFNFRIKEYIEVKIEPHQALNQQPGWVVYHSAANFRKGNDAVADAIVPLGYLSIQQSFVFLCPEMLDEDPMDADSESYKVKVCVITVSTHTKTIPIYSKESLGGGALKHEGVPYTFAGQNISTEGLGTYEPYILGVLKSAADAREDAKQSSVYKKFSKIDQEDAELEQLHAQSKAFKQLMARAHGRNNGNNE